MAATVTLPQFLDTTGTLTRAEKLTLIDQAGAMISQLYVHLSLKRAMHATDPVQRLALIRTRLSTLSERQFHDEMIDIFTDLRDLHTNYILPTPYNTKVAFLPFLLEELFSGGRRKYMVTKMLAGFTHPTFAPGVIVTDWNGAPIDRAIEANADRNAGSNPDARHARGLEAMTVRSMMMASPPDEHWVIVGYKDGATAREVKLDWSVFEPDPTPSGGGNAVTGHSLGLDANVEMARRAKKALFNPQAMGVERAAASVKRAAPAPAAASTMPDVFSFKTVTTPAGPLGYLRIWTFMAGEAVFVEEMMRILSLLPAEGLIIDVRGNGGGNIMCAELILQLLTPRPVSPTTLSFVNSPLTLAICKNNAFAAQWAPSIEQSIETGEIHSQGFSLLSAPEYNLIGQRYQGPVVLVTDPLCYSATDIFSAGFQDNTIGPVLSAGGRTGAGGANVWDHDLLQQVLPAPSSPFRPLPKGASFRVAIRRVLRSGERQGVPLEDLGVVPNANHKMTKNDVLNGNGDLVAAAAKLLATAQRVSLSATTTGKTAGKRTLTVITQGIDRVDVLVDGRPRLSADVTDGTTPVPISNPGPGTHTFVLHGYEGGALRATFTVAK